MESIGVVGDLKRATLLALEVLVALGLSSACRSAGDGASETDGTKVAPTACERLAGSVRTCGLLSDGDTGCGDVQTTQLSACFAECYEAAECLELELLFCRQTLGSGLGSCIANCQASAPRFTCDDGSAILADWVCDTVYDCSDGSDESECAEGATFACGDGAIQPADYECDDVADCADGSDEIGCPEPALLICPS